MGPVHATVLLAAGAAAAAGAQLPAQLFIDNDAGLAELRNGFTRLVFNMARGSFDVAQGDFTGAGDFFRQPNAAPGSSTVGAAPASLPPNMQQGSLSLVVTGDGTSLRETGTSFFPLSKPAQVAIISNTTDLAGFSVTLFDGPSARVSAVFNVTLASTSRSYRMDVSASALCSFTTTAVRLSTAWTPASSTMMYSAGVRQAMMMNSPYLAAYSPWDWWFGVGYSGGVDIAPLNGATSSMGTVLVSSAPWHGRRSGLDLILAGNLPTGGWMDGFEGAAPVNISAGTTWPTISMSITVNNFDFPSSKTPVAPSGMALDDYRAILTAIYANPVGSLHSYDYQPEGRQAPCININGNVCYGGLYNFFDPDSGVHVSAMAFSFDPSVWGEAKKILETNERFLCPSSAPSSLCVPGQMMHHFVESCGLFDRTCVCTKNPVNPTINDCVSYAAISGAIQTGPNVFWSWATLTLAAVSGDAAWLGKRLPSLRYAMSFLLNAIDSRVGLMNVGNSLFIDTFKRANYTTDTNAAAVLLFGKMADAEASIGNATGAAFYLSTASTIRVALGKYLLAPSGDHFCTNSNPNPDGSVDVCARDFVDYDGNTLAVWAGAANSATAQAILSRIDSGPCAHNNYGTWVSEIFYDENNCNAKNTGDSAVAMGRIAWTDCHARRVLGDAANAAVALNTIIAPMQSDLLANTWMYERYQCQGKPAHSNFYTEYPEVVALALLECKYGLDLGMSAITVDPLVLDPTAPPSWDVNLGSGPTAFHIGWYAGTSFTATLPYSGTRAFTVTHVKPGTWTVSAATQRSDGAAAVVHLQQDVPVGPDGVLSFSSPVGVSVTVTATLS